jgi:hypothetical protein
LLTFGRDTLAGGMRLNVFDEMIVGKAVVLSADGTEGIPVEDHSSIRIAKSAEGSAHSLTNLLQDLTERCKLGRGDRRRLEQEYGWSASRITLNRGSEACALDPS